MNFQTLFRRVALTGATSVAAFASGAAVEPAPAGAHCGGHNFSCSWTGVYEFTHCVWVGSGPEGVFMQMDRYGAYYNECSGTCYNGGTEGCCDSPEACAEADCKPGGCGGPCGSAYYSWDSWNGQYC